MEFDHYQRKAWQFDQHQDDANRGLTIALLGLGGEVGTLQTTQKKAVRDLNGHVDSRANALEDLGDILWYVADAATWLGENLQDIAEANLAKIERRWPRSDTPIPSRQILRSSPPGATRRLARLGPAQIFDGRFPISERLPRQFEVHFAEMANTDGRVLPIMNGAPCGNRLGDNSYDPDGYRWHDAFHLAHASVLGWSPVLRALLKRKRKSDNQVDDVDDGGRAVAIEEGVTALVFEAATRADFYRDIGTVDGDLLRTVQRMVAGLEIGIATPMEWEHAILRGCGAWRTVHDAGHGAIVCDLDARTVQARPLTSSELAEHDRVAQKALSEELAVKPALFRRRRLARSALVGQIRNYLRRHS